MPMTSTYMQPPMLGLRVYEKKESGNLELFAYEVKEYDNA